MYLNKPLVFLSFLLFSLPTLNAPAQSSFDNEPDSAVFAERDFNAVERRDRGWFGGPKTETPVEEMELARRYADEGRLAKAAKRYLSITRWWGESPQAPLASKARADILMELGEMEDAFEEYQYLVKFYAGQFDYRDVIARQMKIANHMMTEPRRFLFIVGFKAPEKSIPYFRQVIANAPTMEFAPGAQYSIGVVSEDMGEHNEAILAYDAVMTKYRTHGLAPDAAFSKAVCLMKLADKAPRDESALREALSAMVTFAVTYPSGAKAEQAGAYVDQMKERLAKMNFDRALFYEEVARKDAAAVIAYSEFLKQFPLSGLADEARARIENLKAKQGAKE